MENRQGKFIVIDGTDGSGKTTQLNLLRKKLETEGYNVEVADFPQYNTKSAGMIEEYLSGKYGQADEVDPYKASIFYAVDRFDASQKIADWLKNGKIVLANRYTSASLGHQGGKIENLLERKIFFNWLYDLEYKVFEIPRPDLTIILQVETEISYKLAKNRKREDWKGKTNDIHEDNLDHLRKAEQAYLEIASSLPDFKLIKCTHNGEILSPEAIHFLVWLFAGQLISQKQKFSQDFQAIGNIISSNHNIVKNRETVLNKAVENNPSSSISSPSSYAPALNFQKINDQNENLASKQKLIIKKIHPKAKLPQKIHSDDAGYDLFSVDHYSIPAYGQALVSTGIKMIIPKNCAGLIWDKSGLANEGITTMGGLIDSGYRGEIRVVVKNLSEDIFNIVPGQKVAQIIIQRLQEVDLEEGEISNDTTRQNKGFGSTGKF
jgi:dTMP kinase